MSGNGSGSAQVTPLEPADLEDVAVVAQCLDNQWVPRELLARMFTAGLGLADVAAERRQRVYGEYIRAFVNARQVVVNRAFFLNNPTVFYNFTHDRGEKAALRTLLGAGRLVPYLYVENSPLDEVPFHVDPKIAQAWRRLLADTPVSCLRLSWEAEVNRRRTYDALARPASNFATSMVSLMADPSAAERLVRDCRLDMADVPTLRARLGEVGLWAVREMAEGRQVNREGLYQRFVVTDGSPVAEGRYDGSKPFAGVIKQLFDLQYNVNLPDALGGFPLTPQDSLPRSALQELERARRGTSVDAERLLRLLRNQVFAIAQQDLHVAAFETMRLADVVRLREEQVWHDYIDRLDALLRAPLDFDRLDPIVVGVRDVFASYTRVADRATALVAAHTHSAPRFRWQPVVKFVLKAAGALLFVWFAEGTAFFEAIGEITATTAVELVVDVAIGHLVGGEGTSATLPSTSYELFRGRLERPRDDWAELVAGLRALRGFSESPNAPREARQPPGMAMEKVDA